MFQVVATATVYGSRNRVHGGVHKACFPSACRVPGETIPNIPLNACSSHAPTRSKAQCSRTCRWGWSLKMRVSTWFHQCRARRSQWTCLEIYSPAWPGYRTDCRACPHRLPFRRSRLRLVRLHVSCNSRLKTSMKTALLMSLVIKTTTR